MRVAAGGDPEAEPSCQECPAHLGECEKQQASSSECIDCPYSRPGKEKVDKSKSEGGKERLDVGGTSQLEDRRRVKRDDVD